jgi:SdrD B-like domain
MKRQRTWLFSCMVMAVVLLVAQQSWAHVFGGVIWYDNNCDGIRQGGEPGVSGVIVEVRKCSDGSLVNSVQVDSNGSWSFADGTIPGLPSVPMGGTYYVCYTHLPAGYGFTTQTYPPPTDGTVVSTVYPKTGCAPCFTFNFFFDDTLNNAGLCEGAPPPENPLTSGDTATIGFWHNKNGQALINALNGGSNSTALATWLATNFPYLYGANAGANNLTGKNNRNVAAYDLNCFGVKGQKTDAQILGAALATYVTDSDLAGTVAAGYGFNVSSTGTGAKTYNIGSYGTAIGLSNNTSYSVFQLLQQANFMKQIGQFNANAFNSIFDGINSSGDLN